MDDYNTISDLALLGAKSRVDALTAEVRHVMSKASPSLSDLKKARSYLFDATKTMDIIIEQLKQEES